MQAKRAQILYTIALYTGMDIEEPECDRANYL